MSEHLSIRKQPGFVLAVSRKLWIAHEYD